MTSKPMTRSEAIRILLDNAQMIESEWGPGDFSEETDEALTALGVTRKEMNENRQ